MDNHLILSYQDSHFESHFQVYCCSSFGILVLPANCQVNLRQHGGVPREVATEQEEGNTTKDMEEEVLQGSQWNALLLRGEDTSSFE